MSSIAVAWAFVSIEERGGELTAAMKLVLLRLADRADPRGVCWPGHERTAYDLKLSASTVRAAIAALARAGLLEVIRRRDADGRDKPNLYQLHIDRPKIVGVPNSGTRLPEPGGEVPKSAPEPENKSNQKEKQEHIAPPRAAASGAAVFRRRSRANCRPGSPLEIVDGIRVYRATDDAERLAKSRQRVSQDVFSTLVAKLPEPRYVSQVEASVEAFLAAETAKEAEHQRRVESAKARTEADERRNSLAAIAARDAAIKNLAALLHTRLPGRYSGEE